MKKTTIKNFTPRNFKKVAEYIEIEKHYLPHDAERIARDLFETLAANPGGNIWTYADQLLIEDLDHARRNIKMVIKDAECIKVYIAKRALENNEHAARFGYKYLTDADAEKIKSLACLMDNVMKMLEAWTNENC